MSSSVFLFPAPESFSFQNVSLPGGAPSVRLGVWVYVEMSGCRVACLSVCLAVEVSVCLTVLSGADPCKTRHIDSFDINLPREPTLEPFRCISRPWQGTKDVCPL